MISSEIIDLLLNKYVLGGISVVISLIVAYFKGHSAATKAADAQKALDEQQRQAALMEAAAKNQTLKEKGIIDIEKVNQAVSVIKLMRLFGALQRSKNKSGPSNKNPQ